MADYTDAYGLWIDLGTHAATTDWQTFDRPSQAGILFRFTFTVDWDEWTSGNGYRSWAWFRFAHHDDSGTFQYVEPAFRLYPKPEAMFMEKPILATLYNHTYVYRKGSFKQIIDYRTKINAAAVQPDGSIPVIPWSLKVEYLDDKDGMATTTSETKLTDIDFNPNPLPPLPLGFPFFDG